jgi:hypothetical protein
VRKLLGRLSSEVAGREIGFRVVGTGSRSNWACILSVLNLRILLQGDLLITYVGKAIKCIRTGYLERL